MRRRRGEEEEEAEDDEEEEEEEGDQGSPRHRMTAGESPKGEGPVYQLPRPHSPFHKPGLQSVCLSYTFMYFHIYMYR